MNQKKKYIILVSLSVFMIFVYIWSDLFVREQLDLKQKQLTLLNKELQAGKGVMDEIQSLRQKFIKDTDRLIAKKVTGNELLQEIDRLNTLANSLNIDLKKRFIYKSVIYHYGGGSLDYKNPKKLFYNIRNQRWMILKNMNVCLAIFRQTMMRY